MKRTLHALGMACALVAATPALAYEYNTCYSQPVRWASSGQTFQVSAISFPTGYWRDTIERSRTFFNANPSQAYFSLATDTNGLGMDNGENEVWGSIDNSILQGAPAITYWWKTCYSILGTVVNHLDEADIIFDYRAPWQWTGDETKSSLIYYTGSLRQMQTTGLHEFGHAFGLMHESDEYNIMGADFTHMHANSSTARGYLGEDASDGLANIYGAWGANYQELSVSHWKYAYASGQYSWHQRVKAYNATTGAELPATTVNGEPGYRVSKGQKVRVEFTYENSGESTQSPNVAWYVSSNDWITTADRRLSISSLTLARDNVYTIKRTVTIPKNLTSNTNYWLGTIINYDNALPDWDSSNNATYVPIRVN